MINDIENYIFGGLNYPWLIFLLSLFFVFIVIYYMKKRDENSILLIFKASDSDDIFSMRKFIAFISVITYNIMVIYETMANKSFNNNHLFVYTVIILSYFAKNMNWSDLLNHKK